MNWLISLFSTPIMSFVGSVIKSLTNEQVEELQARTGLAATEALAAVNAENVRVSAQRDAQLAAMNHPIWWVAWTLFVIPVGMYDALIHMKSVLAPFAPSVLLWNIPEVPKEIESWDMYVILSMFGLAVTSSVVTTIVRNLGKA